MRDELPPRQQRVADLVADGYSDPQIAATLGICIQTVRCHIDRIVINWKLDKARNLRVQIARRIERRRSA